MRIGCDLMNMSRLDGITLDDSDPFIRRTFTIDEIAAADRADDVRRYYAKVFSIKESVYKTLRIDDTRRVVLEAQLGRSLSFRDIRVELVRDWPTASLADDLAAALGGVRSCEVSVSYDGDLVMSTAVVDFLG
ncbi:4'-phosphopantetheinyl transferase superfamily protein [Bifidobacterium simiarum]|uniref:4'-phosphopantetheinyl transferase domain-containing protein n=1 Tax=Bifidobacterium simiarum TaxID=2045441 RepID=A0A2M9HG33_9BIFI|nr:4'-phosphopantetheinyl transferase superfamily protein [Bifidobacterium simiarum]PJM75788.1 hypothetical protein CSQ87_02625 [Bifidobacterium simiarum]